jgi:hypothetical protein
VISLENVIFDDYVNDVELDEGVYVVVCVDELWYDNYVIGG